jgi:hypothetical protein
MWNVLSVVIASSYLSAQAAPNADPAFPLTGIYAVERLTAEPKAEPQYAYKGSPAAAAMAGSMPRFRSAGWRGLDGDAFRGPIFSTPLPGRGVVPAGAELAAPVITPEIGKHGHIVYDVTPAGRVDVFDPVATQHPEDFIYGPATDPLPWKVWGSVEMLLGTTRGVNVPPVVTTGPAVLGLGLAGAPGQPGTVALFGGRKMLDDWRAGFRGEVGVWFDDARVWGAAARFYSLFSTSEQLVGGGNGTNVVNVPQVARIAGLSIPFPIYVGFPGLTTGSVSTTAQTNFAGGDLSVRRMLRQGASWRLDALAGYRQLHLGDELGVGFVASGAQLVPALAPALLGSDSLRTRNNFYGAQLGGIGSINRKRWTLQGSTAVALGVNASDLNFDRSRSVSALGLAVPLVQTSLAERTAYFGTVWENGVQLAYRVTDHARITVGYTALYWWNLRRAQEQYTLGPNLSGTTTHFHAYLFSWGAELRY